MVRLLRTPIGPLWVRQPYKFMKGPQVNNRIHTWLPQQQSKLNMLVSHFEVLSCWQMNLLSSVQAP